MGKHGDLVSTKKTDVPTESPNDLHKRKPGRKWFSDGRTYTENLGNDEIRHGVIKWPNSSVYRGDIHNGGREGDGCMTWADGSQYTGQWTSDQPDGIGTFTGVDGAKLSCHFKQGEAVASKPMLALGNSGLFPKMWTESV